MSITIEISPGELLDRITILSIKLRRLTDPQKLAYAANELTRLQSVREATLQTDQDISTFLLELEVINEEIWLLTDEVYRRRARGTIDVALAEVCLRAFERNGDRSEVKRKIDVSYGAAVREVKNYGDPIEV